MDQIEVEVVIAQALKRGASPYAVLGLDTGATENDIR